MALAIDVRGVSSRRRAQFPVKGIEQTVRDMSVGLKSSFALEQRQPKGNGIIMVSLS